MENKFLCEDYYKFTISEWEAEGRGRRRLLQRARPGTYSFLPQPPPDTTVTSAYRDIFSIEYII